MEKSLEEKEWEEKINLEIMVPTEKDETDISEFAQKNFYPDEPLISSSGIFSDSSYFGKSLTDYTHDEMILDPLKRNAKTPSCLIARDKSSGNLLAIRMGVVKQRDEVQGDLNLRPFGNMSSCMPIPRSFWMAGNMQRMMDDISYSHKKAFEMFKQDQAIYFASNVTVAREARGKGIGKELIKRAMKLAVKAGCGHSYILATSIYSQKIFKDLGFTVIGSSKYENYLEDLRGRPLLQDTKEHKEMQTVVYDHALAAE